MTALTMEYVRIRSVTVWMDFKVMIVHFPPVLMAVTARDIVLRDNAYVSPHGMDPTVLDLNVPMNVAVMEIV
jgi:hypothetical protein